ncbi:unnamed protein product, partial [marine sediment metagenome]
QGIPADTTEQWSDSAIVDPLDKELMNVIKTYNILTNKILYAHSYLD